MKRPGSIVKYNLSKHKITHNVTSQRISCFFPTHFHTLIDKLDQDDWVLGVQYSNSQDLQIGITGTSCYKENWKRTLTREMAEELKLYPSFNHVEDVKIYKEKEKNWFCCKININKTEPSIKQEFESESPNWKRKIGILVYGDYDSLLTILNNNYKKYSPNDNISHIVMIRVSFIKKYMDVFKDGWNTKKSEDKKNWFHVNI